MPSPTSEALGAQRGVLATHLAERLVAGDAPLSELGDLQERLRLIDCVLAEQRAGSDGHIRQVLAPMALVAIALTLAATVPVPKVPLSLELRATAATLQLAEQTTLGPLALSGASRIEGVTTLESPDTALNRAFSSGRSDALSLQGDETRLRALQVPADARLTLQTGRGAMLVRVEGERAPTTAEFELRGKASLRFGDASHAEERNYEHSEWLRVTAGDGEPATATPPPLALSLGSSAEQPARLTGLKPVALRFAERRDAGGAVASVGSSIEGGTIALPATDDTLQLAAGDWLEVDGLTVERCEVVAGAPLTLRLNGSARSLRLRVGEFERSLKPSWLEYTARHHLVQLLWGSAAVLWGALAWTRKQFAAAR